MKRLISILLICTSCELVVDIDVPRDPVRIVVNGIANTEEVWTLHLSESEYILDDPQSFHPIDGANVIMERQDGSKSTVVNTAAGYYTINEKPQPGETYIVTAVAANRESVRCVVNVPPLTPMIEVKWDSAKAEVNESGSTRIPVNIKFQDMPSVENYYQLEAYTHYVHTYTTQDGKQHRDSVRTTMIIEVLDKKIKTDNQYIFRFDDSFFDGQIYTLPIRLDFIRFYNFYKVDIVLSSMSKDHYKYVQQVELHYETNGDPFAQPIQVEGNVENGFGVIGAITSDTKTYPRRN